MAISFGGEAKDASLGASAIADQAFWHHLLANQLAVGILEAADAGTR